MFPAYVRILDQTIGVRSLSLLRPEFGWLAFGGNIKTEGDTVKVTPLDSFRSRVYVASLGLWLTLDAGRFESVEIDSNNGAVRVGLAAATQFAPTGRLCVEQPSKVKDVGAYRPTKPLESEREAYVVPLGTGVTWVELANHPNSAAH